MFSFNDKCRVRETGQIGTVVAIACNRAKVVSVTLEIDGLEIEYRPWEVESVSSRELDLIYHHGEVKELITVEENEQMQDSKINATVTMSLGELDRLREEKKIAEKTLQCVVETLHELQRTIDRNKGIINYAEALEVYYG